MGCGASKGKSDTEAAAVTELTFKKTDLPDLDSFFDKAKEFLDSIAELTGPLSEEKDKFFDVTGFFLCPGAGKLRRHLMFILEVKMAFIGMFLSLLA